MSITLKVIYFLLQTYFSSLSLVNNAIHIVEKFNEFTLKSTLIFY